jgi:hypothetical protein
MSSDFSSTTFSPPEGELMLSCDFLDSSAFISDYFDKPFLSIEHRHDQEHLSKNFG